ncbi:hypothetical protein Pryu01_01262 [Paraliobacillus ryukyuensis]|uniref:DNA-binding XRE family transcriptional regulator n=1 Tax=Paraliobacillus ryukyuensis TaxID=200904 RepID=A0A366EDC8_9BACI|nr:helix-turn-helix transcriptional regulator [Paraliobacillus ryukyuensis]RBO99504.1 DNA-binding XRE family transcriptional regulator [Paraliobacillus ryukyuensis]
MGLTVKQARQFSELSQAEMAINLGVHRQTYMKWEQCPDAMPLGKAKEFCTITGISIDEIFFKKHSTLSR